MKQTLSLRQGQQLAMTPQLQQSIRLMQLSTLELKLEVRQAIESNPMLELVEEGDEAEAEAEAEAEGTVGTVGAEGAEPDSDPDAEAAATDVIPEELPVDVSWDDVYQPTLTAGSASATDYDDGFEERNSAAASLADHLLWQLNLTPMTDRDQQAALTIIDSIDDNGMLATPVAELVASMDPELGFEADEMEAVLKLVQHFDPPGVGARDLAECLLLQLEQLPADTPWRAAAVSLVGDHFSLLVNRKFTSLAKRIGLTDDELIQVIDLIRSLNPRPGAVIGDTGIEYVEPDVIVARQAGRWTVELNRETLPRVRVNGDYAPLVSAADTSADGQYLKASLQDAKWFLKNLEYRNETLLKVAGEIVKRQRGFLEHGEEAMRPLVLADVAIAVDRHESTISRVTTRKYMATPRGVFELKYFFSSHVGTITGGEVSSTAIRALIKKLTTAENPRKPLSDNKIAALLKQRNIRVARRTVAKYRESMAIPPSNERRRIA